MLTLTSLYYSLIIQTISELMSYANYWPGTESIKIMKYIFVLENFTILVKRQTLHIKLSMALTLMEVERKGNWSSKDRITMWNVMKCFLREIKFEPSLKNWIGISNWRRQERTFQKREHSMLIIMAGLNVLKKWWGF